MEQAFERCKGAIPIADDIQVYGTENTHDMHLHEAMERARSAGIKLNYDKYVIKTKSCTFFGNIFTPDRVKPDPTKVEAIKKMQAPQTKQELQSFLGMVNFLGQFIKNMSELTSNLRSLLKKIPCFSGQRAMKPTFRS